MLRLRSVSALVAWLLAFVYFAVLGRASGSRERLLQSAELLTWIFMLGVLVPTFVHLGLVIASRPTRASVAELRGAPFAFYVMTLLGVVSMSALIVFAPGPDPAAFADELLLHLGRPWFLVPTVAIVVASCSLLVWSVPHGVELWAPLGPKQHVRVRWVSGALASVFALVVLGVISYYALGWAWWVGSTQ